MISSFKGIYPEISEKAFVHSFAFVSGNVKISESCSIWPFASVRGDIEKICIGRNSNIQDGSVLHTSSGKPLNIGENVIVGHRAVLHSCSVGNNCLIGIGAIVLDGAVVEDDTVVAAGALVPPGMRLEKGSVYSGVPAVRKRDIQEKDVSRNVSGVSNYRMLWDAYSKENRLACNEINKDNQSGGI